MKDSTVNVREEAVRLNPQLVEWRRHLHAHPELGFETADTAAFVVARLKEMGVTEIRTGIAKNGVAAVIRGDLPGKVLGMRADMDALPVHEDTGLPFASTVSGRMHACGHDAHTSMLLGAARILTAHRSALKGAVKLIFQPSEETAAGALAMIEDGVMENPKVDAFIGLHTGNFWTGVDAGGIGYSNGPLMAAADLFTITITGKGGHGATPHRTIDPIAIGCQVYTALQTIVSREISPLAPAVLTIGVFQSGSAGNIVPSDCVLKGTLRALSEETRKELQDRIRAISENVAHAMRGRAAVEFHYGPPATVNAPEMTAKLLRAAGAVVGPEKVREVDEPTMGGEDMAFFLEKAPGVFFFHPSTFGGGRDYPHHHPKFDVNEEVLWTGTGTMAQFALTWQDD